MCSGDYSSDNMILDEEISPGLSKYSPYYMKAEGDFFYYYILCCGLAFLCIMLLACCLGSIFFIGGSALALQFAKEMINNVISGDMDQFGEFMRGPGGPPPGPKNDFDNPFFKPDKKEESKNDDDFERAFDQ